MNFEAFQKQARLYVLGALDPAEMKEFEDARKQFGQKAEDSIRDSQALCEAFALSRGEIRPTNHHAVDLTYIAAVERPAHVHLCR